MKADDRVIEICLKPVLNKYIVVFGFNIEVANPEEFLGEIKDFFQSEMAQAVEADLLIDERFVKYAVLNALTSKHRKWISDDSMRLLAFLACEKQIRDALRKIGLKRNFNGRVAVILVSNSPNELREKIKRYVNLRKLNLLSREEIFGGDDEKMRRIVEVFHLNSKEILKLAIGDARRVISNRLVEEMAVLNLKA